MRPLNIINPANTLYFVCSKRERKKGKHYQQYNNLLNGLLQINTRSLGFRFQRIYKIIFTGIEILRKNCTADVSSFSFCETSAIWTNFFPTSIIIQLYILVRIYYLRHFIIAKANKFRNQNY